MQDKSTRNSKGKLIDIALRPQRKADLLQVRAATITQQGGLEGDHAGKRADRLVSMLSVEGWAAACAEVVPPQNPVDDLSWLTRRANLLVRGVDLPRAKGGVVQIGEVVLEITHFTYPCQRMEAAYPGLLKALAKDWRAGVLCKVEKPGQVHIGDDVVVLKSPPEFIRRLP